MLNIKRILDGANLTGQARPYVCLMSPQINQDIFDEARNRGFDNCLKQPIDGAILLKILSLA